MLLDSSLTNILTLSGISNIRYKVFSETTTKESLTNSLLNDEKDDGPSILRHYKELTALNIPSVWQTTSNETSDKDDVLIELWIFWFDSQTFDLLEKQIFLKELQETKSSSFSWNQWCANDLSPTSSPQLNKRNKSPSLTPGFEYMLFIKSIRQLIQNAMLRTKKGFILGDFFVFPNDSAQDIMIDEHHSDTQNTMLACMYNVYLTNSDLVFQPNVRRIRIRLLSSTDINSTNLKVLLSPTGEYAKVVSFQSLPASDLRQTMLNEWSEFYNIPVDNLIPNSEDVPSLITIRTASHGTVVYPSRLAFVPTDTKQTPSAVAGMNGIMGFNRGLAEDLGAKLSRSVYYDRLKSAANQNTVDYWSYQEPVFHAANVIIQRLSKVDEKYLKDQRILHRALIEPIVASPIMESKSVIPSDYDSPSQPLPKPSSSPQSIKSSTLAEFVQTQFGIQPLENIEADNNQDAGNATHLSAMLDKSLTMSSDIEGQQTSEQQIPQQEVDLPSTTEVQQSPQPETNSIELVVNDSDQNMDPFDMMYTVSGGQGNPWDGNDDLGDLDMDLTEADFDFFENAPAAKAPTVNVEPAVSQSKCEAVLSPMEVEPVVTLAENESELQITSLNNVSDLLQETNSSAQSSSKIDDSNILESMDIDKPNIQVSAETHVRQPEAVLQKRTPYQKSAPEPLSFVPRDFLPVPVTTSINESKYETGGKFMYPFPENTTGASHLTKRKIGYSPDYIPHFNLKKSAKKKSQVNSKLSYNNSPDAEMKEVSDYTSDSDSSSCSSDSSSDSDSTMDAEITSSTIKKRFIESTKFQKDIVRSILKPTPAPLPSGQIKQIDYDTPFVRVLSGDRIKPIPWRQNKQMAASVAFLCQQACLGGYPFAGGLAEVSENGGEIEAEPAKVMVTRRTNLMQATRGVVTHVPSLQTDVAQLTREFKQLLNDIFIQKVEEEPIVQAEPAATLNDVPLGKVSVKGPLNIQQYYELNDSRNQAHAKYGKFQVKKKRPSTPNLDTISPPDIVVSRRDEYLMGSHKMLGFWEKLGLAPYSVKKDVQYFAIFPSNPDIKFIMGKFFKELSIVYESCHLGTHEAVDKSAYPQGLVPVSLLPLEDNETSIRQQWRTYETVCEKLANLLVALPESSYHTVIYIVNPGPHMSSYLDMCRCFYKLQETYRKLNPSKYLLSQFRLVLQLIPIDHILRNSAFGGYAFQGMKDIAFSVYSKCAQMVNRKARETGVFSWADLYSPPFVLSKPLQKSIKYKLNDPRPYPVLLDQNNKLHMAYCFSYDRACMIAVWTDDRGELLEYSLLNTKTAYKEAWERTKQIMKRAGFSWFITIAKIGLMFNDELMMWRRVMTNMDDYQVSIIAIDLESALNIHFSACNPGIVSILEQQKFPPGPTFLDANGNSHYGIGITGYSTSQDKGNTLPQLTEAQVLVLNHRISYSHKREKAFKGILRMEAITEKENWMTPLATGYLIHHSLPNKNVNPCMEQFNNEPFVAEIHLLHNQTSYSAYMYYKTTIKQTVHALFVNPVCQGHSCIRVPYCTC